MYLGEKEEEFFRIIFSWLKENMATRRPSPRRQLSSSVPDWFRQCLTNIAYQGGGIPSSKARQILSSVWRLGQDLGLEADELCKWALPRIQMQVDEYLKSVGKPLRKLTYSPPQRIVQQYGLAPGETGYRWAWNPIYGYPPLPSSTPSFASSQYNPFVSQYNPFLSSPSQYDPFESPSSSYPSQYNPFTPSYGQSPRGPLINFD